MQSGVVINIVRRETDINGNVSEEVVATFDGQQGDDTITICNKAKEYAEEQNEAYGNSYREYVTSRID